MSDSLLIYNATICTFGDANRVIEDGAIIIEGGKITAVGTAAELLAAHPDLPREDAGGKLLMPGNICSPHPFLRRVRARPLHSRPRAQGLPGNPAPAVVDAGPGAGRRRRALQRAGLPRGRDPQRHDHPVRSPRQPDGDRRQPGHHRRRGGGGRAARLPVLRGHRPQRAGRRGREHRRERPLHQADAPARSHRHCWPAPLGCTRR